MILPTMNDDEKAYEAFRMTDWLNECFNHAKGDIIDRFERGTRFPYFQRMLCEDDKGNKWWFTCMCPSKDYRRRNRFMTFAYAVYDVPPKRTENRTNAGKGVLIFDPISIRKRLDGQERVSGSMITDITPHAINRYTERYLKPNGRGDIEIQRKVEDIMLRWQHFDISADLEGDVNAAKHTGDGICPLDIIMRGGGMFRGTIINDVFMRLTTYVSEDMMFDNQIERQKEMVREHYEWKRKGLKD